MIDTAGPALSAEAEQGGLAGEIAHCLAELVTLDTPTVSVLLGQGSGGPALAMVPADRVLAALHGWLAPLPPGGCQRDRVPRHRPRPRTVCRARHPLGRPAGLRHRRRRRARASRRRRRAGRVLRPAVRGDRGRTARAARASPAPTGWRPGCGATAISGWVSCPVVRGSAESSAQASRRSRPGSSRRPAAIAARSDTTPNPESGWRSDRTAERASAAGTRVATSGCSCLVKMCCMRCAASALVALDRNRITSASSPFPTLKEVADQRSAHRCPIHLGQVGKLQVKLRRSGEQLVLVAEIPHHHRRVDAGVCGDGPDGGGLETLSTEPLARCGQDGGLGFLRRSSHVNDCRPTSVDIRHRPAHDGKCQQALTFTEEDHHDGHRRPRCRGGTDRTRTGRVAAARRCRRHRRRPNDRGRQHLPRGSGQRPHARGAGRCRRFETNGQGRAHRPAVHHATGGAHADTDRFLDAAHQIPLHTDDFAGHHRGAARRTAGRARGRGAQAQSADPLVAGPRRRDSHFRRRRLHQGALRGGLRRRAQHRT